MGIEEEIMRRLYAEYGNESVSKAIETINRHGMSMDEKTIEFFSGLHNKNKVYAVDSAIKILKEQNIEIYPKNVEYLVNAISDINDSEKEISVEEAIKPIYVAIQRAKDNKLRGDAQTIGILAEAGKKYGYKRIRKAIDLAEKHKIDIVGEHLLQLIEVCGEDSDKIVNQAIAKIKRYGGQLSGYTIGNVVEAVSKGLSERDLRDIIRKASRSF